MIRAFIKLDDRSSLRPTGNAEVGKASISTSGSRTATLLERTPLPDDSRIKGNQETKTIVSFTGPQFSLASISRLRYPTRPLNGLSIGRRMKEMVADGGRGGNTT